MMPSWPKGWPSTRRNRRSRPPPPKESQNVAVASRAEPDIIFSCASQIENKTFCAFSTIRPCPSPTIRPNAVLGIEQAYEKFVERGRRLVARRSYDREH